MKPFFISLSVLFAVITTASSQSKLVFRDKFMYSDTQIFHAKKEFTISSLIDTGCSLCILDSIFAIDSCGIKENTLETKNILYVLMFDFNFTAYNHGN